ncbi:hypothetical protein LTS18_007198 [Coniosporium uncinatum]|uniref:Uncharacterized protein n=1 Tax=Coniosporium uncinatum TaxID=93489 RepID=A0ACC3DPL4_9PEZI|nr:hypothetical protein LTS18_007198 [Coniosporium uncinatum]
MAPAALIDLTPESFDVPSKAQNFSSWSEPLAIGGDDQWLYLPDTRQFDLSRGSTRKLAIPADDGSHNHSGVVVDPDKTVLVIVDMQNYFIHPHFFHHPTGLAAIEPILSVIQRCREEGIQICWLNWVVDDYDMKVMPPSVQRCFSKNRIQERGHGWSVNLGSTIPETGEKVLWKGSWNADIYDPLKAAVREDDVVCTKNRMSGLWRADEPLHQYLRATDKKTLLFAGINTDQCLLSSLTDAHSWGWDCMLVSDCAGTNTGSAAQAVSEYNIATNMGFCTDSKAILDAVPLPDLGRSDSGYCSPVPELAVPV